ncbi:MAG: hypothetical protein K0R87_2576 [Pseudonocardia sp.]|nr:hypothetical protein [Pseudonocardia sp.]
MSVVATDAFGQSADLDGVEVVDLDRDPGAAELGDEIRGLLDRLGPVVVGATPGRPAGPARAHDGRAGLTERGCDASSCSAGGAGDNGHATPQGVAVRLPAHGRRIGPAAPGHGLEGNRQRGERATSDNPRSLARMATRAEMRSPGTMERMLGRGGGDF